jgi:energy-coupling factor transporter ATP-binding protein EcfA2
MLARALVPDDDGHEADLTLDLWEVGETGVYGPSLRGSDEIGDRQGSAGERFALSADGLYSRYSGPSFLIQHGRRERRAVGWVNDVDTLSPWNRTRPWQMLIVDWLGASGATLLHAALVGRPGRGVLIIGPSGSGKSTVAAACVEAGFDYLGDDVIAAEATSSGPFVGHCLYAALKFNRSAASSFPMLSARAEPYSDPFSDELFVHIYEAARAQARRSAEIAAIAFPVLSSASMSSFRPCTRGRALRKLTGSQLFTDAEHISDSFARMSAMVEQTAAFTFEVGRDAGSIAPALEALLADTA